jgi:P-type Ca2+ transporter type 2C
MHRVEVLHDRVPGRLRLSVPCIRGRPLLAKALQASLPTLPSIAAAEARPSTGSLILRHAPAQSADAMLAAVRSVLDDLPEQRPDDEPSSGDRKRDGREHRACAAGSGNTDPERGLAEDEAARLLLEHGPNILPRERAPGSAELLAKQFRGLPVAMLSGSAAVSLATGGVADALATAAVVALNGVLGFITEGEAERTIHALIDSSTTRVCALRGGVPVRIPASGLVPGDVILVEPGTQIAADARLLDAEGLRVDESTLTGESLPIAKRPCDQAAVTVDPSGMLYAGTIIAEGRGRGLVVGTGAATEAGRIQLLSTGARRPQAPLEVELDRLGGRLALASLAACALFVGLGLLRGYRLAPLLKDAMALAVAAVPEGLPVVATTTLARGLRRMERRGILIRQMSTVESLGALQTMCLDKTGTVTENRMTVTAAAAGTQAVALRDRAALLPLARLAALNNDAVLVDGAVERSSHTERALLAFALDLGVDVETLRRRRPRVHTIERVPGRPWMATLHGRGARPLAVKGAPEAVLGLCAHVLEKGRRRPLTRADRAAILAENDRIAARPARVLALAEGPPPGEDGPGGLTFLGLIGMSDPIRPGAREFVRRIHQAGIETVLITGDQAVTAAATARELDLARGGPLRIVDSAALSEMPPELLAGLAGETHVFARVPSHEKLAIVKALQASGRVVAMTGDGVNDGPALNAADVGIAMGESGTDLAKDVANVVIRDDRLETLADAVAQGRAIYRNVQRALEFLVTTNMSEILVSMVEAVHGPGELETPMELLWINLVSDVLPGLGLAMADPGPDVMDRPPRDPGQPIVPREHALRMGRDSALIAASALAAHFVGLARHGPGPITRGMTFLALAEGQVLYTLVCQRSDPRRLRPEALLENRPLDLALLASSALTALPFVHPGLRRLLDIAPLGRFDLAVALAAASTPLATVLARRSISLALAGTEAKPCETSS